MAWVELREVLKDGSSEAVNSKPEKLMSGFCRGADVSVEISRKTCPFLPGLGSGLEQERDERLSQDRGSGGRGDLAQASEHGEGWLVRSGEGRIGGFEMETAGKLIPLAE